MPASQQSNFTRVLQNHEPLSESGIKSCSDAWAALRRTSELLPAVVIDMMELRDCIDCKVLFSAKSGEAPGLITLFVVLYSHLPLPVTFSALRVVFTSPNYKNVAMQCDGQSCDAEQALVPGSSKVMVLSFSAMANTNHNLKCKTITVEVGSGDAEAGSIQLQWKFNLDSTSLPGPTPPKYYTKSQLTVAQFDDVVAQPAIAILSKKSGFVLALQHLPPVLVQERFPVTLLVRSEFEEPFTHTRYRTIHHPVP